MTPADAKKALLTAARAYTRAANAKTCSLAQTNFRHGQEWSYRGYAGYRAHVPAKTELSRMSPSQRELFDLWSDLAITEDRAHQNRLDRCDITQMQHERAYKEERARAEGATDHTIDKRYQQASTQREKKARRTKRRRTRRAKRSGRKS